MQKKALVVVDIQNDITKNYKEIIGSINKAIDWAADNGVHVVYIRHEYLSDTMKKFKPNTYGSELTADLKIVSDNIFTKYQLSACSCEAFTNFLKKNEISETYLVGADAIYCLKSTCYNLLKLNYKVTVLSDCITSCDKKQLPDMLRYYESKGSRVIGLDELY